LGLVSLLMTLIAWGGWPSVPPQPASGTARTATPGLPIAALLIEYGLTAAGLVPHMVFLVDFIARGLGAGIVIGGLYWVVFGLGAVAGPLLAGAVADRIGFGRALRLGFLLAAAVVLLPAITRAPPALVLSSLLAGAFTPGVVPLVLGRVHELLPNDPPAQRIAWSWTTIAFATFQAGSAYLYSFLFARSSGNYTLLFTLGAGALALASAIDFAVAGREAKILPPVGGGTETNVARYEPRSGGAPRR
ncbi:MAG: YbfB/YjiJ family MFS transporter, partial [Acetobacteraceae bacterium]